MNLKDKTIDNKKLVALALVLLVAFAGFYSASNLAPVQAQTLNVEIQPRDIKLYVGQRQLFNVIVHNGTSPFEAKWYSNGTFIGSGLTVEFWFETPTTYTILSVSVTDSLGNIGFDSTYVYDPTQVYITPESFVENYDFLVGYNSDLNYFYKNGTSSTIIANHSDAETLIEWTIGNCSDYDAIYFTSATYDINDEIDDQGKNGIGIYGTWGSIFDIDTKDNDKHGFLLTNVDDWIFDGIAFEAVTVSDGSPGHENAGIEMQGTNDNIEIRYVRFNNVNGYSISVEAEALGATYTTNLWIHHNHQDDAGHSFLRLSGVNYSRIENNWCNKSDEGLDSEHIWLAGNDVGGTDLYSCHNIITGNTFLGGSIAVNIDDWDTSNPNSASHNIVSNNNIYHPPNSTASDYSAIYVNTDNNQIMNNHIVDLRTSKSTGVIVITNDGAGEPRKGIICSGNYIWHVSGSGISAYNVAHNGTIMIGNRIMGRYGDSYNSIYLNDASNDYCVVALNIACSLITVSGNGNGYEAGNLQNVAD